MDRLTAFLPGPGSSALQVGPLAAPREVLHRQRERELRGGDQGQPGGEEPERCAGARGQERGEDMHDQPHGPSARPHPGMQFNRNLEFSVQILDMLWDNFTTGDTTSLDMFHNSKHIYNLGLIMGLIQNVY